MHHGTKNRLAWIGLALASLLLFGCSNGSSHSTPASPSTGTFVDSAVEGLSYTAGDLSGTTNAAGEFEYFPGDTVTFSIGDLVLGSCYAKALVTPVDLTTDADSADDVVLNIARLLITLDEDGVPDNGITITANDAATLSEELAEKAAEGETVDFDIATSQFDVEPLLAAVGIETGLVTAETACAHLQESLGLDLCSGLPDAFIPSAFPTAADAYEDELGDDTPETAGILPLATDQYRTIYPDRDNDWVTVDLTAGIEYEFSTNNLSPFGDSYLYLYDTDGSTPIASDDDYLYYDSQIVFTPEVDGTYYLQVKSYRQSFGVLAYTLNARERFDTDGDGYSNYYDCADDDDTIHPRAEEIAGDGIDQDCNGVDTLLAETVDAAEPDDTPADAVAMAAIRNSWPEARYRATGIYTENARTLHEAGQEDYFSVTVQPGGLVMVNVEDTSEILLTTLLDTDGTTELDSAILESVTRGGWRYSVLEIGNETDEAQTYFVRFEATNGTDTGYYVPFYEDYGVDADGDGFYSQDWAGDWDCDDNDATVNPEAVEIGGDGIDQDCSGAD